MFKMKTPSTAPKLQSSRFLNLDFEQDFESSHKFLKCILTWFFPSFEPQIKKRFLEFLPRGKVKLERLRCEQFLQGFRISCTFLPAKQVSKKRGKIQNPVKIVHQAVVLFCVIISSTERAADISPIFLVTVTRRPYILGPLYLYSSVTLLHLFIIWI